jgi:hypothetical protein
MDTNRLSFLVNQVRYKKASKAETDEYMAFLLQQDTISKRQYKEYKKGNNLDELLQIALIVGAAILRGWLLNKMLE